jgi:hypothetical protein
MDHHAAEDLGLAVFLAEDYFETVVETEGFDLDGQLGMEHRSNSHQEDKGKKSFHGFIS